MTAGMLAEEDISVLERWLASAFETWPLTGDEGEDGAVDDGAVGGTGVVGGTGAGTANVPVVAPAPGPERLSRTLAAEGGSQLIETVRVDRMSDTVSVDDGDQESAPAAAAVPTPTPSVDSAPAVDPAAPIGGAPAVDRAALAGRAPAVGTTSPADQTAPTSAPASPTDQAAPMTGRTAPTGPASSATSQSPDGPAPSPPPADLVAELAEVLEAVSSMAGADWHELPGPSAHDALDKLEQIGRQLAGVRSRVVSSVEAEGLWALDGSRTFVSWLRRRTGTTAGAASRQVRESRAVRDHLPLAGAALEAGEISQEHVSVLVREAVGTQQLRAQLADADMGEAFLVGQAKIMDAGTFTKLVKAWAIRADPEAADRAWREADAKEQLTIAPTTGGYHVAGWLDDASGQAVCAALSAHMGRKAAGDERTPSQRRAAALVSLARQSLDVGLQGASSRVRPHLTVTMSLETIRALVAAMGSAVPPIIPDAAPDAPGVAFGIAADSILAAPGGPRDHDAPAGGTLFELSPEARAWMDDWRPGDDHVIATAIDPDMMRGVEPAMLEDGTPIPPALLARLACESSLSRVVFGPGPRSSTPVARSGSSRPTRCGRSSRETGTASTRTATNHPGSGT